jgi:hypothetical protein
MATASQERKQSNGSCSQPYSYRLHPREGHLQDSPVAGVAHVHAAAVPHNVMGEPGWKLHPLQLSTCGRTGGAQWGLDRASTGRPKSCMPAEGWEAVENGNVPVCAVHKYPPTTRPSECHWQAIRQMPLAFGGVCHQR